MWRKCCGCPLIVGASFKHYNLLFSQETPFAAWQVFLGQSGIVHTVEFFHFISERLEHAAHNAVAA